MPPFRLRLVPIAFLWLPVCPAVAQTGFRLEIIYLGDASAVRKGTSPSRQEVFSDTFSVAREVNTVLFGLYGDGYLTASCDSLVYDSLAARAYLHTGEQYEWLSLQKAAGAEALYEQAGFREKLYVNRPFAYARLYRLYENILQHAENNGYPFASVFLDSVQIEDGRVSAVLKIEKGFPVLVDSLSWTGEARIRDRFLHYYLGLRPGDLYNEALVKRADARLRELPFARVDKPLQVWFHPPYPGEQSGGAAMRFFLQPKRASRVNGVLGVTPRENVPGRFLLTGELDMSMHNVFEQGEQMQLTYKGLPGKSQSLKTRVQYPYIFSPAGADLSMQIYKKDSSYLDLAREIGAQYMLTGNNHVKVFVRDKRTNLLYVDTLLVRARKRLPDNLETRVLSYGIGGRYEKLDYRYNPRRGWVADARASVGTRRILKTESILNITDTFDYAALYDSLSLRTAQYQAELLLERYLSLSSRQVLRLAGRGGYIGSESIFLNEMYRLGGMNSLRGFDEESVTASLYEILTVEYRYLLEENSYFYLFADGAWYRNDLREQEDTPFGFGAGVSFETGAGIFSLSYALGKEMNNPLRFRSAKIHFGYVNYF